MKNFVEVCVKTSIDCIELLGMVENPDLLGAWEKDGVIYLYWPEEPWSEQILEQLRSAVASLSGGTQEIDITTNLVPDQDWNSAWAKSITPIRIGRRVLIRQSWNAAIPFPGMIELIIDPKRTFGTGFHATTQLLIEWLEDRVKGGERVLDCGTGSGILSMVALRLGAVSAVGIDNDPVAIECAREYAAVNAFGSELSLRVAGIEELGPEKFDLVLANLDRNSFVRYSGTLVSRMSASGVLLITGICPEDYDEIVSAFAATGCRVGGKKERDGWIALDVTSA